jgi:CBS domain-containing protein
MRIKDIMEKKFAVIQADDRLDHMLEVLSAKGLSSAPVFDKSEFIGIISYSDLARFFAPQESVSLPFMGNGHQNDAKIIASAIAKKPPFVFTPDMPVRLAIGKMNGSDCVPVMGKSGVIGIVRPRNVIEFFLAERAKTELVEDKNDAEKVYEETSTSIDRILEIVARDHETTPKKVAAELKISEKTAEDMGKLLGKHKLVDINYSFMTGMVIRRVEHGSG